MADSQDFLRRLGTAIAAHRRDRKLTQEAVAELLGSSPEWVSQIERGVGRPSLETILALGVALGIPATDLVRAAESAPDSWPEHQELVVLARRLGRPAVSVLLATAKAIEAAGVAACPTPGT